MFGIGVRSLPVMSDSALILAHRAGDDSAFPVLVNRHRDSVMGFLINRVGDDAEDLFQETWARVNAGLDQYQDAGSFRAWLFQIARRLVIDHYRRKTARVKLVLPAETPTPSAVDIAQPDQTVAANQMADCIKQALDTMPEATADVVRMRLFEGVSFKEIAARQGVPLNTALSRMHRGLNLLRARMLNQGLIPPERMT
jgi:RNA polymerase sigma-70 factor (ECF subfamily)